MPQTPSATQLREISLSRIVVPQDFNPRGPIADDAERRARRDHSRAWGAAADLVRATTTGEYALIAGERRFRAAKKAELAVLPALVREAGNGDDAEHASLAADAVIENELRKPLDPVQRALGYRQMMLDGLTVKGVAERLGGIPPARVRETLAILELPDSVHQKIADATVPLTAVKALVKLNRIHPGLPAVAVKRVSSRPTRSWDERLTWDDLTSDPVAIVIGRYDDDHADLPADVYVAGHAYPADRFTLSTKANRDLAALRKAAPDTPPDAFQVRFDRHLTERALSLKAARPARSALVHLIVGQDVADQLASDCIRQLRKDQQARLRRERDLERQRTEATTKGTSPAEPPRTRRSGPRASGLSRRPSASGPTRTTTRSAQRSSSTSPRSRSATAS